jgi:hypothetical protein
MFNKNIKLTATRLNIAVLVPSFLTLAYEFKPGRLDERFSK